MFASELITYLQDAIKEHGDLPVCHSEPHDEWGSYNSDLADGYNLQVKTTIGIGGARGEIIDKAIVIG